MGSSWKDQLNWTVICWHKMNQLKSIWVKSSYNFKRQTMQTQCSGFKSLDLVAPLASPNSESECLDCKLCCAGLPYKTTTQVYTHPINLGCSMSFSLLNWLIPAISLGWSIHYLDWERSLNCRANDREVHYSYLFHTCIVTAIQNTRSVGYITPRNSKQSQTEGFNLLSYLRVHDGHCT